MPLRGETVGTAFVKILADGDGLDRSIRDEFRDADGSFQQLGRRHSEAYQEGFDDQIDSLTPRMIRGLEAGIRRNSGRFDAIGSQIADDIFDPLDRQFRHRFGDTVGKQMSKDLREAFSDYHPDARGLIEACVAGPLLKTALFERRPLARWSDGRATLLGDSAHAMIPFMAQGAAMALEDAVLLARCLERSGTGEGAERGLRRYELLRTEWTRNLQEASRANVATKTNALIEGVYAYDAWQIQLEDAVGEGPAA